MVRSFIGRRWFSSVALGSLIATMLVACAPVVSARPGTHPATIAATAGPTPAAASVAFVPPSAAKTAGAVFALTPHPTATATVAPTATPAGAPVPFAAVERLLVGNCAGCHPPNQGLDLTAGHVYANTVQVPSREDPSLLRIRPGDPAASFLFLKVSEARPPRGARMPLGSPPLSSDELTTLRAWIAQGATGP